MFLPLERRQGKSEWLNSRRRKPSPVLVLRFRPGAIDLWTPPSPIRTRSSCSQVALGTTWVANATRVGLSCWRKRTCLEERISTESLLKNMGLLQENMPLELENSNFLYLSNHEDSHCRCFRGSGFWPRKLTREGAVDPLLWKRTEVTRIPNFKS